MPHQERTCKHCGKTEMVPHNRAQRPYCGKACRDAAYAGTETPLTREEAYQRRIDRNRKRAQENAEAARERARATYHRNPAPYKERARIRRYDLERATPIKREEWQSALDYYGCCAYCGDREPLTKDHIIPLVSGGEHAIANIAPACPTCNASKGPKSLLQWLWITGGEHGIHR